jgi:hypothetical protein
MEGNWPQHIFMRDVNLTTRETAALARDGCEGRAGPSTFCSALLDLTPFSGKPLIAITGGLQRNCFLDYGSGHLDLTSCSPDCATRLLNYLSTSCHVSCRVFSIPIQKIVFRGPNTEGNDTQRSFPLAAHFSHQRDIQVPAMFHSCPPLSTAELGVTNVLSFPRHSILNELG